MGLLSVQVAFVPPFDPLQVQRYCVEESTSSTRVPAVQVLLVVPQRPLTGVELVEGTHLTSLLGLALSPIAFFAYTRNIYSVPFSRPAIVAVLLATEIVPSKTEQTTSDVFLYSIMYSVISEPPSDTGAFHESVTCPSPVTALSRIGFHGIVDVIVSP